MAWTTPFSAVANTPIRASDHNGVRDNLLYLFSGRGGASYALDAGGTYSTSSLNFVDIDSTWMAQTVTIRSGKALVLFTGAFYEPGALSLGLYLDITVDGARLGGAGAYGLAKVSLNNSVQTVCLAMLVTSLTVASHVFRVQWMVDRSTAYLLAGNGMGGQDCLPTISVLEVG